MGKPFYCSLVLALVIALSCTEERTTICPLETEIVRFEGVLYGWRCGVGDCLNNPPTKAQLRFGSFTGESASITLIRDNGFTTWFKTDDSSRFVRYVSAGSYKLVIETGYTWPGDTVPNVHLAPGDTVLELNIVYDVVDPDTISFDFFYPSIDDTVGIEQEFQAVLKLNEAARIVGMPGPLQVYRSMSPEEFSVNRSFWIPYGSSSYYVVYGLPITREGYHGYPVGWNVVQAYWAIHDAAEADTTGRFDNLSIWPKGAYACLLQASN